MAGVEEIFRRKNRIATELIPRNVYSSLLGGELESQQELLELKLPSQIRIQPDAFNAATYEIEDPLAFKNDTGVLKERECEVDNIIRYRFVDQNEEDDEIGVKTKKVCLTQ